MTAEAKEAQGQYTNVALTIAESLASDQTGKVDLSRAWEPFSSFNKRPLSKSLLYHGLVPGSLGGQLPNQVIETALTTMSESELEEMGLKLKPLKELPREVISTALSYINPNQVAAMIVASKQPDRTTFRRRVGDKAEVEEVDLTASLDDRCRGLRDILAEFTDNEVRAVLVASAARRLSFYTENPSLRSSVLSLADLITKLTQRGQPSQDLSEA